MTLHLLKCPVNPLAIELMQSSEQSTPAIAVLLSPSGEAPPLPGITIYQVTESPVESTKADPNTISYARLMEMIFSADKVLAW